MPAKPARGVPIPRPKPVLEARGSKLDRKKIASIQADTVALQAILGEVFDETGSHGEPAVDSANTSSEGPRGSECYGARNPLPWP